MPACPVLPDPSAARPPIFPPVKTTFAGSSDEPDQPYVLLADRIERLIRRFRSTPEEELTYVHLQAHATALEAFEVQVSQFLFHERWIDPVEFTHPLIGRAFPLGSTRNERLLANLRDQLVCELSRVRPMLEFARLLDRTEDSGS